MQIKDFYSGKTILLSGTTGFIGKVVLEKMLRSLPTIKRIYILIRAKKSMTIQERMMQTIFTSEIFGRVFKEQPDLKSKLLDKVVPIAGDLVQDSLGLKPLDRQLLVKEVNVIINCAASVNFDDPILDALQINYFGAKRCLDLAEECANLITFTHVSTAYVNCNQPSNSLIEEKVYDLPNNQDCEEAVAQVLKMNPQQCSEQEKQIIGRFPNTYTYSKSMAERYLKKKHGKVRVTIVRPSIVISCADEPMKGWTETLSAAGGLTYTISIGVANYMQMIKKTLIDIVPCDFVSNMIICASWHSARCPPGHFQVSHAATSHLNPVTIESYADILLKYIKYNPFAKQVFEPHVFFCETEKTYEARLAVQQQAPLKAMNLFARATGNAKMTKQIDELQKVNAKMYDMMALFAHFFNNSWIYKGSLIDVFWPMMTPKEQQEFCCNVRFVRWKEALPDYAYGIRRFFIREDCLEPRDAYQQVIPKNQIRYFDDLRYLMQNGPSINEKKLSKYFNSVLSAQRFQDYLAKKQVNMQNFTLNTGSQENKKREMPLKEQNTSLNLQMESAKAQLSEMNTNVTKGGKRFMIWFMNKVQRMSVQGLYIHQPSMQQIKNLQAGGKRVVLMPLFKSLVDPLVLTYALNHSGIEQPFIFGNHEDTQRNTFFNALVKKNGYIHCRRKVQQNVQSWYVSAAIMKEVIDDNSLTVVYQNDSRPRTGKLAQIDQGDLSVQWLLDAYLNIAEQEKDLHIVPVMVNYDRIFETYDMSNEMVSGDTKLQNTKDFQEKFARFKKDMLGDIYIKMLEPIDVRKFLNNNGFQNFKFNMLDDAALKLSQELYTIQASNTPVTLNSIVSAFLLLEKSTTTDVDTLELLKRIQLIFNYIKQKEHISCFMNIPPQQAILEKTVQGLGFVVKSAGKKDSKILLKNMHKDWRVQMTLAHYSLNLSSFFIIEICFTYIIHMHFSMLGKPEPIKVDKLFEKAKKLVDLLDREHLFKYNFDKQQIDSRFQFWAERKYISYENNEIVLFKDTPIIRILEFWASMSQVYLDSYLIVLMGLDNIAGSNIIVKRKHIVRTLRKAVKILYGEKIIPHVHSCIADLLHTAISKYGDMKMIEINAYANDLGSFTPYIPGNTIDDKAVTQQMAFLIEIGNRTNQQIKRMQDVVASCMTMVSAPQPIARM